MFSAMLEHMPDAIKDTAMKEFGSVEEWREHYLNAVSCEEVQKQYAKIVEWYGGLEDAAQLHRLFGWDSV